MPPAEGHTSQPPPACRKIRTIIFLLCLTAAVRVFIFSAAFPPMNNVDEYMHFDLAVKYSHGQVPQGVELLSPDALEYIVIYGSQEYFWPPETFPGNKFPPPPWTRPVKEVAPILLAREKAWQRTNFESSQAPLYYLLVGFWWHVGQWLGLEGGHLFYWLRFLNIIFLVALVCLSYALARTLFPENSFLQLGLPALMAFVPQSAFYSLENDVLSPLCFGAAFFCVIKFLYTDSPRVPWGACAGLALAATFLTKMTNLPFLAIIGAAVLLKIFTLLKIKQLRAFLPALAFFLFCAILPAIPWVVWCKIHFGDFTGSAAKAHSFGWTVKPFTEWWHHPIFTPFGLWTYLSGQLATFWQGEFLWHDQPMALPGTDAVYTFVSLAILLVTAFRLLPRFTNPTLLPTSALRLGLACFVAGVALFALMSTVYDFHNCPNPSRDFPYFHAGRMLLGSLLPFLLLFAYGLDQVLNQFGTGAKFLALAVIVTAMQSVEIIANWPAFSSSYNWFHLP